jgi:hypothetical protein
MAMFGVPLKCAGINEKTSKASRRFFREKLDQGFRRVGKRAGVTAVANDWVLMLDFRILDSGTVGCFGQNKDAPDSVYHLRK